VPVAATITHFDAPWRTPPATIARAARALSADLLLTQVLEAFPSLAVVVDDNRQIVAVNAATLQALGSSSPRELLGRRLGEILGCVHAGEAPAGCGTTPACCACGAAFALRAARERRERQAMECRIVAERAGRTLALDVRVHATPIWLSGRYFTVLSLEDIAADKRRQALERVFFHDVLNTAHALGAQVELLGEIETLDAALELSEHLHHSVSQLVQEIRAQRDLAAAERGDLIVQRQHLPANLVLLGIRDLYGAGHEATLACHPASETVFVDTDRTLAVRALGNLVKNALEATPPGGEVSVCVEPGRVDVAYHVHNPTVIPAEHQVQVFQRSFTTKGEPGRGLGTYGARLIVEEYLGGHVDFRSSEGSGTAFSLYLPRAH
jgi:signal transduction histidine kinase